MPRKVETTKGRVIRLARARAKAALLRALRDLSVAEGIFEAMNGRYEGVDPKRDSDWRTRNRLRDPILALVDSLREMSDRNLHRFMQESSAISTRARVLLSNDIIEAEKKAGLRP